MQFEAVRVDADIKGLGREEHKCIKSSLLPETGLRDSESQGCADSLKLRLVRDGQNRANGRDESIQTSLVMLQPRRSMLGSAWETRQARQHRDCFVTLAECSQQLIKILDGPYATHFPQPPLEIPDKYAR